MDYELMMNGNVKIGQKAPDFKAITTFSEKIALEDYKGKWLILFSHPGDFTPVYSYNWGRLKDNCHLALLRLRLKSNQRARARLIDFKLARLAK